VDASKLVTAARDSGLLIAAALAIANAAAKGSIHGDDFGVGCLLRHNRFVWVDWGAAYAAETTRVLQRVKDLFFASCEVSKLGQGFAPEALLEAASTGLSQNEFIGIRKVALQGIRAAVAHNIGFHY